MARYFFDICDDALAATDPEGEEWRSREDAGRRARQILVQIAAESPFEQPECHLLAKVRDETGRIVFVATLTAVGKCLDVPVALPLSSTSLSRQLAALVA